jgi:hypothetical protein
MASVSSCSIKVPVFDAYEDSEELRAACDSVARKLCPGLRCEPVVHQGGCSYTILVSSETKQQNDAVAEPFLLQFRDLRYAVDVGIAAAAKAVYGSMAPQIDEVATIYFGERATSPSQFSEKGFQICKIQCVEGVSYLQIHPRNQRLTADELYRQCYAIKGFANFVAKAWIDQGSFLKSGRRDSVHQLEMTGKVGSSLQERIQRLAEELPAEGLRRYTSLVLSSLDNLNQLPVVINHGDIVPSNMIISPSTGELTGLVDWAEAEYLPFGTCLYGLEHLLGFVTTTSDGVTETFQYYELADQLRNLFWDEICRGIPQLKESRSLRAAVLLAKDIGVLLWHGYAWDDGRIDRVINPKDDARDLMLLKAFLRC